MSLESYSQQLVSTLSKVGLSPGSTPLLPGSFKLSKVVSGLQPSKGAPGTIATEQTLASKPALTEYLGPGPKDDSTSHRYLFLLFRKPGNLSLSKSDVGGEEFFDLRSFKAAEWVAEHGLELVSVNWMLGAGDGWKGIAPGHAKEL
ncbi:uncharacterized protein RAG0_13432 [Rhynchosporium agropyri]|uniref:Phosphatidylethanolamine-binding protein n=1 Tax=Rhynchosporium agropyri TaxID=914238 RepID=A0A1E1LCP8_9HELO|nr:uncharacterized protein RAG0_13432 [Rhynchosporium agropyri]